MKSFSRKTCERLRYYVYLYIDPRTNQPFYIGQGKGNRAFVHLKHRTDSEKVKVIDELAKLKKEPQIEILKYGLSKKEALLVESTAIDLLGVGELTNLARGHGSRVGSRASVKEVASLLDSKPIKISDRMILINITQGFRYGMSPAELYDATRSAWVVGKRRHAADFALCVYAKVVREVYAIAGWHPDRSTMRAADTIESDMPEPEEDRWEFVGRIADEVTRKKYIDKSVEGFFAQGASNPIQYINCDPPKRLKRVKK